MAAVIRWMKAGSDGRGAGLLPAPIPPHGEILPRDNCARAVSSRRRGPTAG